MDAVTTMCVVDVVFKAIKAQIELDLRSRSDIARGLGLDYSDVLREIAEERAFAESLGIDLGTDETVAEVDDSMA